MTKADTQLRFAAALGTSADAFEAFDAACQTALAQLGATPDFAVLFVSQAFRDQFEPLVERAVDRLGTDKLIGTTAESVLGESRELEHEPAVSLWLARLPGVGVCTMHLTFERTADGGSLVGWPDELMDWPESSSLLVLGEPFTFPAEVLLERVNEDRPGVPVAGGMASGGGMLGENLLACGRHVVPEGAVLACLAGPLRVRTIVSQGCRPIGRPLVITRAEGNRIFELGGMPALAQVKQLFDQLPNSEKQLVQRGLHLGRVVSEYRERFEQGDFLVRKVTGIDARSQAISVGDYMRPGQTIQFQIRDEQSASEELRQLLAAVPPSPGPRGALLFTCNGRGTRLFHQPDHDVAAVQQALGPLPLAGFFAQGEIGPVGGRNFVHGFTASLALFEAP